MFLEGREGETRAGVIFNQCGCCRYCCWQDTVPMSTPKDMSYPLTPPPQPPPQPPARPLPATATATAPAPAEAIATGAAAAQNLGLRTCNPRACVPPVLVWVAVKELKLSYYIGETLLFTIYTHYGNLI